MRLHMGSTRIQVVLGLSEKAVLGEAAGRAGESLSAFLRKAALQAAEQERKRVRFTRVKDLDAFFAVCDKRERGREPDWPEHEEAMESSRARGRSRT
jgi:uncharacterized protein (DUF1778 family)